MHKTNRVFGWCVIGGVALLVGGLILAANMSCCMEMPREAAAEGKLSEFRSKLEVYRMISGRYPTTAQGLEALVERPDLDPVPDRWKAQFRQLPRDPWNSDYRYTLRKGPTPEEDTYEVLSIGADLRAGTEDDISTLDP